MNLATDTPSFFYGQLLGILRCPSWSDAPDSVLLNALKNWMATIFLFLLFWLEEAK
jgi:hypothetical protein